MLSKYLPGELMQGLTPHGGIVEQTSKTTPSPLSLSQSGIHIERDIESDKGRGAFIQQMCLAYEVCTWPPLQVR